MATANLTTHAVERLAAALDQLAAERWDDFAATYAWVHHVDDDYLDLRLGAPPETRALAVAVTSVGIGRRVDGGDSGEQTVRVTVAASCCQVAAVVRHRDGRVEHASHAEGVTVATLRQWASLAPCCACACASQRNGSSARQRHI